MKGWGLTEMNGVKPGHTADGSEKALQVKRRKDGVILSGFNITIVIFFVAIYFMSLLGLAL